MPRKTIFESIKVPTHVKKLVVYTARKEQKKIWEAVQERFEHPLIDVIVEGKPAPIYVAHNKREDV